MSANAAGHFEKEIGEEDKSDKHRCILQGPFDTLIRACLLDEDNAHVAEILCGHRAEVEILPRAFNPAREIRHAPAGLESVLTVADIMLPGQDTASKARARPVGDHAERGILGERANREPLRAAEFQTDRDL